MGKHNKNTPQSSTFILAKNKELVLSKERANEQWDLAHLELEDSLYDMNIPDPFEDMTEDDFRHPDRFIMSLMMEPDYFGWTCKHLFGIDLLPMQCAVLKELWYRPFPILCCSRGFGKSFILSLYAILRALFLPGRKVLIVGAGFRQSKIVFGYAEAIWMTSPILRDLCGGGKAQGPHHDTDLWYMGIGDSVIKSIPLGDGSKIRGQRANDILADEYSCLRANTLVETDRGIMRISDSFNEEFNLYTGDSNILERPAKFIKTPKTDVYKIKTKWGYEFGCSNIHQVETVDGWKLGKDLKKGDLLTFNNNYKFPERYIELDGITVDENLGWIMGLTTAEGHLNDKHAITVHMTDLDCINRLKKSWNKLDYKLNPRIYHMDSYRDDRGWDSKEAWICNLCNLNLRNKLENLGLAKSVAIDKKIPWSILQSPKSVVIAFLAGLFEGDGSAFHWKDERIDNRLGVAYYSVSETLCREVQFLLLKLNILSSIQTRESNLSDNLQWMLRLNGQYAVDFATMLNIPKWKNKLDTCYKPRVLGCRGLVWDKSRNAWNAHAKINNKRKFLGRFKSKQDAIDIIKKTEDGLSACIEVISVEKLPEQENLYDYYLPESHSFYGNGFRQHNSIPKAIFDEVIAGFGVVAQEPVEKVKDRIRLEKSKSNPQWLGSQKNNSDDQSISNQIVISGTASFAFNHFADTWKKYKTIIKSQGDPVKMSKSGINPKTNWKAYSIIRIPVDLLPPGFMDQDNVERSRETMHTDLYTNEYGACFSSDSSGFYKRSLIEKCVVNPRKPIILPSGEVDIFHTKMDGTPGKKYIYGIDPAATKDSFAICILEIHPDHARVVHMWTTDVGDHQKRLENKEKISNNYFAFCVRKIRDLMKIFPCELISMDAQGGGKTIAEAFKDEKHIEEGELPILEIEQGHVLWDEKPKADDGKPGLHIIEMVPYGRYEYSYEANNGLKNDLEHQRILFPFYDSIELVLAGKSDMEQNREFDTLEEVISEIEELKNEMTIIQVIPSDSGREKWAAPEIRDPNSNKKGRSHDDRYSALLMANMAARRMRLAPKPIVYEPAGGFVGQSGPRIVNPTGQLYIGPAWLQEKMKQAGVYGTYVKRGGD